jgi:predicted nucleotidyltransferase
MKVYREAPAFTQFDPPPGVRLPVDLMFVADEVFDQMRADAEPASVGGVSFGVVSLLHLIALKCHAIRHGKPIRCVKDTEDLIQLVSINHLDLNEPELRATILRHGDQELYEKLQRACASE